MTERILNARDSASEPGGVVNLIDGGSSIRTPALAMTHEVLEVRGSGK